MTTAIPPQKARAQHMTATEVTSNDSTGGRAACCPSERVAAHKDQRSGKVLVSAFIVLVATVTAYFAFGMPGMTHGGSALPSMAGMEMSSAASRHRIVTPEEFEALLDRDATVINVHVPDEGQIPGTDLTMPYNALDIAKLPSDRSSKLLVYCMTGGMSAKAVAALLELGYTDVIELDGGMKAWMNSGRQLLGKG